MMVPEARSFYERIRVAVSSSLDLSRMSVWLERNTSHPKDTSEPWSFEGHEFQRDIIDDSANTLVVRKCSQVGLSELTVRLAMAYLSIKRGHTAIYTLPTAGFATKFAKGRIFPVINNSEVLSAAVNKDVFSTSLIQLGDSFLYIGGTFNDSAAISVPADMLLHDEVDFSNPSVLTTYSSRLGHAENGGIKRLFSTPTVENYGISKAFEESSKAVRMVKCDCCKKWVAPDFFSDLIIEGFEGSVREIHSDDIEAGYVNPENASLHCPECRHKLSVENLADPAKRRWVHEFPDRKARGYQVFPWDVPQINPPSRTLAQITEYKRKADWVNFKLGLPYEDETTSVLASQLERAFTLPPFNLETQTETGCVMGVDVGKISWVIIGKRIDSRTFHVIHYERIRQDGSDYLKRRLLELVEQFGVMLTVVDAAPDFTTAMGLIEALPAGVAFGNYYARNANKTMSNITVKEDEQIVISYRTGTLTDMVASVNAGKVLFARSEEAKTVKEHLRALKKISREDSTGAVAETWVSNGPDHYGHAMNYTLIADEMLEKGAANAGLPVLPMPAKVRMKEDTPNAVAL